MKEDTEERAIKVAEYFLLTSGATVRSTAKHFGLSKSTVYIDLTKRLKYHLLLQIGVEGKLQVNKRERAQRGGEATRQRYLLMKKK